MNDCNWKDYQSLLTTLAIIEGFGLQGTFKGRLVQPPCNVLRQLLLDQVARAPSNLALNVSIGRVSTASLGNLFQCLAALVVTKNCICLVHT